MNFLQGLSVLVLGLGDSGLAMARWCVRSGAAAVRVWDSREAPPQAAALAALGVPCRGGVLQPDALDGVQLVLKSPGLAPHDGRIAPLLAAARERAIATGGELTLFARALADLRAECGYAPHVLAITGTNGKTTTTALTALLVERAGQRVAVAGNIGPTMLDTLAAALDAAAGDGGEPLPEAWVLELSSFQLEDGRGFEPSAAVVLNVTQDHLDWHGTMPAYAAAKARIYGQDAVMVIPRDDPLVAAMVPPPPVAPKKGPRPPARRVVSFGLDAPRRAGDFGLSDEGGMCWLVRAVAADEGEAKPRRGDPAAAAEPAVQLQRLMPMDALRLRGRHNAANALAALALATAIGCPLAPMLHGLREYRGEPHRVEPVGLVDGVEAFDDSKGTNVGATVAALESLGLDKHPGKLVVILGGDGKGQDFAPLAAPLARHARAVALIGKDAEAIAAAIAPAGVPASRHADLGAATRWCFTQARGGDAVLLSPACASLDMFRNYAHRAEVFLAEVRAIGAERGEVQ